VRVLQILALGSDLRREADLHGDCINEAHYLVHQVVSHAFAERSQLPPGDALHDELLARLQRRLTPVLSLEVCDAR